MKAHFKELSMKKLSDVLPHLKYDVYIPKIKDAIAKAELKELAMKKLSTESINELAQLLWLNVRVGAGNVVEYGKILCNYYSNAQFFKSDVSLVLMYLFHNPYSISKRFLTTRGDDNIDAYGETPLTTLETIVRTCGVGPRDHVFELGCGRGRGCFWLNAFIGCKVTGIEFVPDFVERANMIKNKLGLDGITFINQDMTQADFTGGTVFYVYGSALEDDVIRELAKKFEKMPTGTKIITVSFPLADYTASGSFELMRCFSGEYPWGVADVYLQVRK